MHPFWSCPASNFGIRSKFDRGFQASPWVTTRTATRKKIHLHRSKPKPLLQPQTQPIPALSWIHPPSNPNQTPKQPTPLVATPNQWRHSQNNRLQTPQTESKKKNIEAQPHQKFVGNPLPDLMTARWQTQEYCCRFDTARPSLDCCSDRDFCVDLLGQHGPIFWFELCTQLKKYMGKAWSNIVGILEYYAGPINTCGPTHKVNTVGYPLVFKVQTVHDTFASSIYLVEAVVTS